MAQHPAGWPSAHGCNDWSPANGGANGVTCDACDVGGPPKPLLNASACNDNIKRLAAWRSASRSSAVCRLQIEKQNGNWMKIVIYIVWVFIKQMEWINYVLFILQLLKSQRQR